MNTKQEIILTGNIILGISKDNDLVIAELSNNFMNKDKYYYFVNHWYSELITEEYGIEQARERLSDKDYWSDIGMIDNKSFLSDFINFDDVAEYVLRVDGWHNTNGEYSYFGTVDGVEYYSNLNAIGQELTERPLKVVFIDEEDLEYFSKRQSINIKDKKPMAELKRMVSKYAVQDKDSICKKWKEGLGNEA